MTEPATERHPPGRRRLRSTVRPDGYETWTIELVQYEVLRELILRVTDDLDMGVGVELKTWSRPRRRS